MFGLFKKRRTEMNGNHYSDTDAKEQIADSTVRVVQKQSDDLIAEIRRARVRRMLRGALENGDRT